jgi:hypothetical protein
MDNFPDVPKKATVADVRKILTGMTDAQTWNFAAMAVACAGLRAQERGLVEAEEACINFVEAFHRLFGTTELRDLAVN